LPIDEAGRKTKNLNSDYVRNMFIMKCNLEQG
jgi:hypothetical protein